MADDSMRPTDEPVDELLRSDDFDGTLAAIDRTITDALPGISRTLWRGVFWGGTEQAIIGYGRIEQPRPRGASVEWFLLGLARQKRHVSLYVNAADGREYLTKSYAPRLGTAPGSVKAGAAALTFGSAADVDFAVLAELAAHTGRVQPYD
ncbi:DUF1801 domain-containing protein [Demequina sp. NBRC 110053]|uniref:DUF1801 domain-containing protein n=1 Tax=Demequina sp. NBRC 110053 TaxID=1570342 RepID=UPI000A0431FD|nr:DUF1801 domain-containing protein [Demequina sp. NBRC 110053]